MSKYRWNKREITFDPNKEGYFNLVSGRWVKQKPRTHPEYIQWENPPLVGPRDQIIEFFRNNNLAPPQELSPPEAKTITAQAPEVKIASGASETERIIANVTNTVQRAIAQVIGTKVPLLPLPVQPFQEEAGKVCPMRGSALFASDRDRIEDLSDAEIDSLCPFSFTGLRVKAKVTQIIDGDTFDLAFYVPIRMVASTRTVSKQTGPGAIIRGSKSTGIFIKHRCRLYGADAAEKNTAAGKVAIELFTNTLAKYKNYVYIWCWHGDKYGRLMVDLYYTSLYDRKILEDLLAYTHPTYGKVYKTYYGGTKEAFEEPESKIIPLSTIQAQPSFGIPAPQATRPQVPLGIPATQVSLATQPQFSLGIPATQYGFTPIQPGMLGIGLR